MASLFVTQAFCAINITPLDTTALTQSDLWGVYTIQQTSSKLPATVMLNVCWTFAGSCKHPISDQNTDSEIAKLTGWTNSTIAQGPSHSTTVEHPDIWWKTSTLYRFLVKKNPLYCNFADCAVETMDRFSSVSLLVSVESNYGAGTITVTCGPLFCVPELRLTSLRTG